MTLQVLPLGVVTLQVLLLGAVIVQLTDADHKGRERTPRCRPTSPAL